MKPNQPVEIGVNNVTERPKWPKCEIKGTSVYYSMVIELLI